MSLGSDLSHGEDCAPLSISALLLHICVSACGSQLSLHPVGWGSPWRWVLHPCQQRGFSMSHPQRVLKPRKSTAPCCLNLRLLAALWICQQVNNRCTKSLLVLYSIHVLCAASSHSLHRGLQYTEHLVIYSLNPGSECAVRVFTMLWLTSGDSTMLTGTG